MAKKYRDIKLPEIAKIINEHIAEREYQSRRKYGIKTHHSRSFKPRGSEKEKWSRIL